MVQYPQSFNLFDYFDGTVKATGIVEDLFGVCRRKLVVDLVGTRHENQLKLVEHFYYDDGEQQQRVWWVTKTSEEQYEGIADDIIGLAKGVVEGSMLRWRYKMRLPLAGNSIVFYFDDRMYLLPNNVLINRARIRKWGIPVGSVTLLFQPVR